MRSEIRGHRSFELPWTPSEGRYVDRDMLIAFAGILRSAAKALDDLRDDADRAHAMVPDGWIATESFNLNDRFGSFQIDAREPKDG